MKSWASVAVRPSASSVGSSDRGGGVHVNAAGTATSLGTVSIVGDSVTRGRGENIVANFSLGAGVAIQVDHKTTCTLHADEGGKVWAFVVEADNTV